MMNILKIDMINPLCFDRLEKGLSHGIVPTIAFATHTLDEAVLFKCFSKFITSVLNPSVRVDNQSLTRFSSPERVLKGLKNHLMAQRPTDSPSDNTSREEVNKDRQIRPTRLCPNIGNITDPHFVCSRNDKIPVKQIRRNRVGMFRMGRRFKLLSNFRGDTHLPHPIGNPISTVLLTALQKLMGYLNAAISALTTLINRFYLYIQPNIFYLTTAAGPSSPQKNQSYCL